jgi:hypothetical protein
MITQRQIDVWFWHHPVKSAEQKAAYQKIRETGALLATVIVQNTPSSADQTAAVRKVREAVMTANAAIACHEESDLG